MIGSNDCGKGCSWCDGDCQNFGVPIPKEKKKTLWELARPSLDGRFGKVVIFGTGGSAEAGRCFMGTDPYKEKHGH